MLYLIKNYTKNCRFFVFLTPLLVILESACEILLPFLMADIVEKGVRQGNLSVIYQTGSLMVLLAVCALLFGVLSARSAAYATSKFTANIREALFDKTMSFSEVELSKFSVGSLITRINFDTMNIAQTFTMALRLIFRAPAMIIFSIVLLIIINPGLLVIFYSIPVLIIGIILIFKAATPYFKKIFAGIDKLNQVAKEDIDGIRTVKSFTNEQVEIDKFQDSVEFIAKNGLKTDKIFNLFNPFVILIFYGCLAVLYIISTPIVLSHSIATIDVVSASTYMLMVLNNILMVGFCIIMYSMSAQAIKRVKEVLQSQNSILNPEVALPMSDDASIEFKHVTFKYKEESAPEVLSGLSFRIQKGEMLGIIGETGSGKTTIVSLLSRLMDPTAGEVCIAGNNIKNYELHELREYIGVVQQRNLLFKGTIRSNLEFGLEGASQEALDSATKMACAYDFIVEKEDGFDALVEQKGANFSGGQKQRLCIARAIIKNPKVLVFDDSTSAVDTKTDAIIQKALKNELPNTTKIIVAQRILSVKQCDYILVLKDGKINGFGKHEDLLENNALYKEIAQSQEAVGGRN